MTIIFKYILRSIREKKFRTFLIIFSIAAAAALCLSSSLISDSLLKMFTDKQKEFSGSADIVVTAGKDSQSPYFDEGIIPSSFDDKLVYVSKMLNSSGVYKNEDTTVRLNLLGMDMDDVKDMNPVKTEKNEKLGSFEKNKIILSSKTAKKYKISKGDSIKISINQQEYSFEVLALVKAEGLFSSMSLQNNALVPKETLEEIMMASNQVSALYLKVESEENKEDVINDLEEELPDYKIESSTSSGEVGDSTRMLSMVLDILLVIEIIISAFIIYSSFKVITNERIPELGVFLSVGSTKRKIRTILLSEGIGYGVTGGVIGCGIGIGILYGIAKILGPQITGSSNISIELKPLSVLFSFLLAVVLSFCSALLPVLKVSKLPIKEVLLNIVENKVKKKGKFSVVLGVAFLGFGVAAPLLADGKIAMIADVIAIGLTIIGIVLLIPVVSRWILVILGKLFSLFLGDDAQVSVNNLGKNKNIKGNITFLTIGIACLFMITVVCNNVLKGILDTFENATYDVYFSVDAIDDDTLSELEDVDGISSLQPFYVQNGVEVKGSSSSISFLDGVNPANYKDYMNVKLCGDSKKMLEELGEDRNIILNKMHGTAYSVKKGDSITLNTNEGWKKYKVIGFMDTVWNGGNYCIIADNIFKKDFDRKYYDYVALKTSKKSSKVLDTLIDQFGTNESDSYTIDTARKTILDGSNTMFMVLNAFSTLTAIIGLFGIFNNIILSFYNRKRELAVMRSVGMSKKQVAKMLILEAISVGIIGSIFGVAGGVMLIQIMQGIISAVMATIPMKFGVGMIVKMIVGGILVTLLATISTVVKSTKLSIIESLKYE